MLEGIFKKNNYVNILWTPFPLSLSLSVQIHTAGVYCEIVQTESQSQGKAMTYADIALLQYNTMHPSLQFLLQIIL